MFTHKYFFTPLKKQKLQRKMIQYLGLLVCIAVFARKLCLLLAFGTYDLAKNLQGPTCCNWHIYGVYYLNIFIRPTLFSPQTTWDSWKLWLTLRDVSFLKKILYHRAIAIRYLNNRHSILKHLPLKVFVLFISHLRYLCCIFFLELSLVSCFNVTIKCLLLLFPWRDKVGRF